MREDLVGYLMGAIDDSEREEIDARLQSDPEFRERLAHVEQKLSPLGYDESPITAPAGLADRTLAFIDQNSKANLASIQGLDGLEKACKMVDVPVVAIAGITADRVSEVLDAGAHGVAIMSAISTAEDPRAATRAFRDEIDGFFA